MDQGAWWATVHGVAKSQTRLNEFTFTFHFHALKKEMATHSSVLAWRIPGTGEPGGLQSMGSHRVGHDWSDLAAAAAAVINDVVYLHVPLVICTSSARFLTRLFGFLCWYWVCMSSLYILDINSLSVILFANISHSVGGLFVLLRVSFAIQNFFSFM